MSNSRNKAVLSARKTKESSKGDLIEDKWMDIRVEYIGDLEEVGKQGDNLSKRYEWVTEEIPAKVGIKNRKKGVRNEDILDREHITGDDEFSKEVDRTSQGR